MDGVDQEILKKWWKSGRRGILCGEEQAKAWGIAWAMERYFKVVVNYEAIAAAVVKVGGGKPTREAVRELCNRVDDDPDRGEAGKQIRSRTEKPPRPR